MANPQLENGHVRIANEVVEALFKVNLSPYETRLLWVVLRKTYGWNKKIDWISLKQFAEATGIAKPNIIRTIKRLEARRLLVVYRDSKSQPTYRFQKNYDLWRMESIVSTDNKTRLKGQNAMEKDSHSSKTSVISTDNKTLSLEIPTKDTIQKTKYICQFGCAWCVWAFYCETMDK